MPKKLKVFRAHLGFYDSIVAASSQKAAAAAWGSDISLFQHKTAALTTDSGAVDAALAQPGVVLRRPFGSRGAFKEKPDLPKVPKLTTSDTRDLAKRRDESKKQKRAEEKRAKTEENKRKRAEFAELDRQEKEIARRRAALKRR